MNHTEAVEKKLTESYLLGELTEEECTAFEEHYFTCAQCAEDIKAAAALVANVKHVLKEEPSLGAASDRVSSHAGWFSWWRPAYSFAAVAAVLAILIYQNVVTIPRIKGEFAKNNAPQVLASYSFITQGSRGANLLMVRIEPIQPFSLWVDVPASSGFSSYTLTIQSDSGVVDLSVPVSAGKAKDSFELLVPGSLLRPGKYALVILGNQEGKQAAEVARYPFVVEFKNEGTNR